MLNLGGDVLLAVGTVHHGWRKGQVLHLYHLWGRKSLLSIHILQVFDLLGDTAVPGAGVVEFSSSSGGLWPER